MRPVSLARLFEGPIEVKVQQVAPYETYTAININPYPKGEALVSPYTLEEQLMMYPIVAPLNNMPLSVVVHNPPRGYVVIDVE